MDETWVQDPQGPRLYGSFLYGQGYFGSAEWDDASPTDVTWTAQVLSSQTWTGLSPTDVTWSAQTISSQTWTEQ